MRRERAGHGAIWTLIGALAALSGCEPYEARLPETGASLEGTIAYGDAKVPLAEIMVWGEKTQALGQVDDDGRYRVVNVPLGEVRIGVNTEAVRGQVIGQQMAQSYKGPGSKASGRPTRPPFISVPAKYSDPDTSGISTTTKKGKNEFDIVIKPAGKP
jgi:hypothetical protein